MLGHTPAAAASPTPRAIDFEQGLGGVEPVRSPKRETLYRSAAIEAPRRFDAVGLAGERRPLEIRARAEGEAWSDWVEVADGDPLYAGGADEVQLRAHGWRPHGRLHYVKVSASAAAKGTPGKPPFVRRREWGANRDNGGCHPRSDPVYGQVKAATVHHTVTANSYSEAEAPGIVLAICRYHRNANGWNDIGYNALVDRFGNLYTGRSGGVGKAVVAAHAQGYNAQTTGISSIGDHTSSPMTAAALDAVAHFLAWKLDRHGIPATGTIRLLSAGGSSNRFPLGARVEVKRIFRHGKTGITACPGLALTNQMAALRAKTARLMD